MKYFRLVDRASLQWENPVLPARFTGACLPEVAPCGQ